MAAGGPGDHPLTDILSYGIEVYGPETDGLVRKIARLASPNELEDWWGREIGWKGDPVLALRKAREEHERLLKRARENGWEIRGGQE